MVDKERQYSIDILAAMTERTIRRLWILIILLIVLLFASNGAWIYYESQFADESWTYEATTERGNAIANGSGEVRIYGDSESDTYQENP